MLVIIDKHYRVNLKKSWGNLKSDLIIRNKFNFKSDVIFKNRRSIFHITLLSIIYVGAYEYEHKPSLILKHVNLSIETVRR